MSVPKIILLAILQDLAELAILNRGKAQDRRFAYPAPRSGGVLLAVGRLSAEALQKEPGIPGRK
jgi:hypothetical protein